MFSRILALLVALILIPPSATGQERLLLQPGTSGSPETLELFVATPEGSGPFPVILLVHGHQGSPRPGGRVFDLLDRRPLHGFVDQGRLERLRERGYLAAALSLPGYGETTGPADFCGPLSQAALAAALDHLFALPEADRARVAVYGTGRGATTAAIVATADPRIAALVLAGGLYDLSEDFPTGDAALDAAVEKEAGTAPEALAARSALPRAGGVRAATLILQGARDTRGNVVNQARRFAERLQAGGVPVRKRILEDVGTVIPVGLQWEEIDTFLLETLGR